MTWERVFISIVLVYWYVRLPAPVLDGQARERTARRRGAAPASLRLIIGTGFSSPHRTAP